MRKRRGAIVYLCNLVGWGKHKGKENKVRREGKVDEKKTCRKGKYLWDVK